jgi:hypothetical protein
LGRVVPRTLARHAEREYSTLFRRVARTSAVTSAAWRRSDRVLRGALERHDRQMSALGQVADAVVELDSRPTPYQRPG